MTVKNIMASGENDFIYFFLLYVYLLIRVLKETARESQQSVKIFSWRSDFFKFSNYWQYFNIFTHGLIVLETKIAIQ
jgi:hypothetical protein